MLRWLVLKKEFQGISMLKCYFFCCCCFRQHLSSIIWGAFAAAVCEVAAAVLLCLLILRSPSATACGVIISCYCLLSSSLCCCLSCLQVTSDEHSSNLQRKAGKATYINRLHLWDKSTGNLTDFDTHFVFVIDSAGNQSFADGLTFFLAPDGSNFTAGGAMGLPIDSNMIAPTSPFVAVEFDTFSNPWDPNISPATHVGIDVNSLRSNVTAVWYSNITHGIENEAWISFGVVALEIACGRRPTCYEGEEDATGSLVVWVWDLYERRKLLEAADLKLGEDFNKYEMERLLTLGVKCTHPNSKIRPSIREAIQVLNFEAPLACLPLSNDDSHSFQ
ncbi:hypothetical protein Vadar_000065 [Vaccinium darrowii]|uniref:Uncharacterized protein n=1 Tax=Vaccinium darrowii TaxID=229202 RepID=A0ACB7WWZ9_9ERIC|nr:hypothetical protein Vadar_000065 [Vaccinium darrowii]